MAGFAGVLAGNPIGAAASAYQDTRKKQQGLDQGDVDAQAQAAAGNAYMGMFGQQQTPGAMPGQPQQGGAPGQPAAQPPQQHGLGGLLQGLLQKLQGAGGGQQPPGMQPSPSAPMPAQQPMMPPPGPGGPPGGMPQAPMQSAAVPGARPMQMSGAPAPQPQQGSVGSPGPGMAVMPPSSASMPGQPQGAPGAPQGQPGAITWQSVVQSVVKANPGVKDPRVIAAAVDKFLPLMNQQTQQQWKEMSLMLRQQQVNLGEQRLQQQGDLGQQRVDVSKDREAGIEKRSGRREDRLERAQVLKQDQQHSMLEMQEKRLQSQIAANKDRTMLGQWRAIVNAQHARAQEIISSAAAGMDPKERKRLLDEEDKAYTDKIKEMKGIMDGGDKPKGSMVGKLGEEIVADKPAATKVASPEEAAKLKPGTRYTTPDGTEYTR